MRLFFIYFSFLFFSCNSSDKQFVRKQIENKDITIEWYYYSHITNNSPDFVVVKKGDQTKEIFKATFAIVSVVLKDSNIVIKILEPSKHLIYTKEIDTQVFGYNVIIDTTGTDQEIRMIPDGIAK